MSKTLKNQRNMFFIVLVAIIFLLAFNSGKKEATSPDGCDPFIEVCIDGGCYPEEQAETLLEQGKQMTTDCTDYDVGDTVTSNEDGFDFMEMLTKKYGGLALWIWIAIGIGGILLFKKK